LRQSMSVSQLSLSTSLSFHFFSLTRTCMQRIHLEPPLFFMKCNFILQKEIEIAITIIFINDFLNVQI
jgi:hypothetical protein